MLEGRLRKAEEMADEEARPVAAKRLKLRGF
jgi:hypothetical protein